VDKPWQHSRLRPRPAHLEGRACRPSRAAALAVLAVPAALAPSRGHRTV